jgi:hypothetical protein
VFDAGVGAAVLRALTVPYYSDVTDFAASWVDARGKYLPRSPVRKGENRFWTRDAAWKGYRVEPMTNQERATAIRQLARSLPSPDREVVLRAVERVMAPGTVVGGWWNPDAKDLLEGVKVIRPGEPGYEEARAAAASRGQADVDLRVANTLDRMYRAVADRVTSLGGSALQAVESVARPVSSLLWAAAAVGLVWWLSKER